MIFLARFVERSLGSDLPGPWHAVEVKGSYAALSLLPDMLRKYGVPVQLIDVDGDVAFGPVIPFERFIGGMRFPKPIWDWIEAATK